MSSLYLTLFLLASDSEPVTLNYALDDHLERPSTGRERRQRVPLSSTL